MNTIRLTPADGVQHERDRSAPSAELREAIIAAVSAALVREVREEAARERTPNNGEAA